MQVLDGDAVEIQGIGFAGVKGFAGGFGRRALGPWGEGVIKLFVREALDEALKLETALSRLRTERRVVLLHYSPIAGTVEGEPLEIYPYLGSSRLEEPLSRYPVDVVFHGHAHHGTAEGRTMGNVPVYNVSMALLQRIRAGGLPFKVVELAVGARTTGQAEGPPGRWASGPTRRAAGSSGGGESAGRRASEADGPPWLSPPREFPSRPARPARSSPAGRALPPAPPEEAASSSRAAASP